MQSTSDFSTDPILRRIEQDMAPSAAGSVASTPQPPLSPAPSSTISSLFSKAMSFGGVPGQHTPTSRQFANMLSPLGAGQRGPSPPGSRARGVLRQRSLESSDSMQSPCGGISGSAGSGSLLGAPPYSGRYRMHPMTRRRSEGGEELGSSSEMLGYPSSTIQAPQGPQGPPRYRPPFSRPSPRGRPLLSRGRSMGEQPTTSYVGSYPRMTSQASTPMSVRSLSGYGGPGAVGDLMYSGCVSAPEETGTEMAGRNLYPHVQVSDSENLRKMSPVNNTAEYRRTLLHPGPSSTRRKLDHTFRTDSLSSDQSENVRPPPPKPHKPKRKAQDFRPVKVNNSLVAGVPGISTSGNRKPRNGRAGFGASSSDDEIRSTPECTSCGEEEMESESVSEKGKVSWLPPRARCVM